MMQFVMKQQRDFTVNVIKDGRDTHVMVTGLFYRIYLLIKNFLPTFYHSPVFYLVLLFDVQLFSTPGPVLAADANFLF